MSFFVTQPKYEKKGGGGSWEWEQDKDASPPSPSPHEFTTEITDWRKIMKFTDGGILLLPITIKPTPAPPFLIEFCHLLDDSYWYVLNRMQRGFKLDRDGDKQDSSLEHPRRGG